MELKSTFISFLLNQSKSFSFIIFILTFALLFINSKINILPLNLLTYVGSVYLFHYNPGYYEVVRVRDPTLTPLLFLYDVTVHYIPLIVALVVAYKVCNTKSHYPLCILILLTYLLLFHSELHHIYFVYERFFVKEYSPNSLTI